MYTLEQSEGQEYGALAVLECRGCEILEFDPKVRSLLLPISRWLTSEQGVWSCKGSESNTPFGEVELSLEEPDGWTDYDEKVRFSSPPATDANNSSHHRAASPSA